MTEKITKIIDEAKERQRRLDILGSQIDKLEADMAEAPLTPERQKLLWPEFSRVYTELLAEMGEAIRLGEEAKPKDKDDATPQ